MADLVTSLEEFATLGVQFISITEQIDTTTPTGRVIFGVIGAMAQFERSILRERVRAGLARARERGVRLGRPTTLDADRIAGMRRDGLSLRDIARQLQAPLSTVADVLRRRAASA